MITAKEAAEIIRKQKEKERKEKEKAERIRQLTLEGKYIPESNLTLKQIEELIKKSIKFNHEEIIVSNKLKDSVIRTLKKNGWYCYLYKEIDTYDRNHFAYRTVVSIQPNPQIQKDSLLQDYHFVKEL